MNYFLRFSLLIIFILIASVSFVTFGIDIKTDFDNSGNRTSINGKVPADTIRGTITGSTSVCLNATQPIITFTGKGGTPPFTFIYKINNGTDITITTASGKDVITVNAPTNVAGNFKYTLVKVIDGTSAFQDVSGEATITVNALPVVDFSFTNNNTCSGIPVQFTPSLIGAYIYEWDFGDLSKSTVSSPFHEFKAVGTGTQTFNVKLTITDISTSCQNSVTKPVTVKQVPDAALNLLGDNGATQYDPVNRVFINCGATKTSPQFIFVAVNASSTNTTNSSYTIDWGDGGLREDFPVTYTKATHTYNNLGFFDIKITSKNINSECPTSTTTYKFFNGNSPAGNLGSLGNVDDCVPYTLTWPVQNTSTNPPGTTYEFSIDDGSAPQKFDHSSLPDSIIHTFTNSSCSLVGYKFTVSFIATNPCAESKTTLQVLATQKPKADFNISPNSNACLNGTVKFTNTSIGSYAIGSSCISNFDKTWSISPVTGWTGNLTNTNSLDIKFNTLGDYSVKLIIKRPNSSDSRCTSDSITKTIHVNPLPFATISGGANVCKDATPPEITFTGSDGTAPYTFTYRINNGSNKTIKTASDNNTVKLQAPTGTPGTFTYTLISVQEGSPSACSQPQTGSAIIIVNPSPTVIFSPAIQTICSGESTAMVTLSSTPAGADINWTTVQPSGISEAISLSGNNTIPVQKMTNITDTLVSVIYKAKATLSGATSCAGAEYTYTIKINPRPVVLGSYKDTICSGTFFSIFPINGDSNNIPTGTKYTWNAPIINPGGVLTGSSGQNTPQSVISQKLVNTTSVIASATYSVTPITNGCSGSPFDIIVSVNPKADLDPINNITLCNNDQNAEIVFGSNAMGTVYKWSTNNVNIGLASSSGSDKIPAFIARNTGTSPITAIVTVTSTSDSGSLKCDGTVQFSITVNPLGQVNYPGNLNACNKQNNSINFTTKNTGGTTTYAWTNSNTDMGIGASGKGNISFIPVSTGNTVLTTTVTVIPTFTSNGVSCEGPSEQFTITVNPLAISLHNKTDIKCFGASTGAVSVDVQGGEPIEVSPGIFDYKYAWTGPGGFTSSNKNLNNIPAGNYNLTVTDNSGCKQAFSAVLKEPAQILVSASTTPISYDGANNASIRLTISGGVFPYQAQWANYASGTFQDNLSAGDYTITVTDANDCQKTITVNIPEPPIFRVSPVAKNVSCFGAHDGSIKLNLLGGKEPVTLSWSDNSTSGTTRNNIGPGTYTVTIHDGTPLTITKTFVIVEPLPLVLTAAITNVFDCTIENNGAIDFLATGGTSPYLFLWSNGATTEDLLNIPAGNYVVTVTDSVGCVQTAQYVVKRPLPIEINVTTKIEYDCASNKIKEVCRAIVSGGVPPYQLNWSAGTVTGINKEIMETDQSGTVVFKVTDALGCFSGYTFDTKILNLGVNYQLLNCNQHAYQFNAVLTNAKDEYNYGWDFDDGTGSNMKNPQHAYKSAGNYKVRLTVTSSEFLCANIYEQMVSVAPVPVVSIDKVPKFCKGDSILIHVTGADSYKWNDGTTNDSILVKRPGNYSVIGFSKAGCTDTVNFTASYFDLMGYTIQSDKTEVTTDNNTIHFWTKNIPFSNYNWDFGDGLTGQGTDFLYPYQITRDGFYDVKLKVINPYGCIEEDSERITIAMATIPNTFTPNGDGINDLYLDGWYKKIYNRNGILLYEGAEAWDGRYNGNPVANDTYFVVVFDSSESGSKYRTYYVTLIR